MNSLEFRESKEQTIEQLLEAAKAKAIPFDMAQEISEKIERLNGETAEGLDVSGDRASLQGILEDSTITVKTLPEFRELMTKVTMSGEHLEDVLSHESEHSAMTQIPGVTHEGYSLLVCKDGDGYRYKTWANYSYPAPRENTQNDLLVEPPKAIAAPHAISESDQQKINEIKKSFGQ